MMMMMIEFSKKKQIRYSGTNARVHRAPVVTTRSSCVRDLLTSLKILRRKNTFFSSIEIRGIQQRPNNESELSILTFILLSFLCQHHHPLFPQTCKPVGVASSSTLTIQQQGSSSSSYCVSIKRYTNKHSNILIDCVWSSQRQFAFLYLKKIVTCTF